ncbi:MAG: flagellar hook capping protein [Frankiales bacterium]|nr:flagellar hook capping protein [Frankiales bacterium]
MTTPISGASSTTGSTQTTSTLADSGLGPDAFMKLLVAQMKYQNPMSPADSNQYMSQMAVFAQVEKLGQLVDAQKTAQAWQERLSAESLVGKQVTGIASDNTDHTGLVTSVTLGVDGPQLTLADGSTLAIGDVTKVEQQTATPAQP